MRSALKLCVRLDPTLGDFGGFFCALFEKLCAGPAQPGRAVETSEEVKEREELKENDELKDSKEVRRANPIPPLLSTCDAQWFVEEFGLLCDAQEVVGWRLCLFSRPGCQCGRAALPHGAASK